MHKNISQTLRLGFYILYLLSINICCVSLLEFHKWPGRMLCKIGFRTMLEIVKNLIRIFGRFSMKKFVCTEVAGFQASILLKMEEMYNTLRTVMASSTVYFFKLQPLHSLICVIDFIETKFL